MKSIMLSDMDYIEGKQTYAIIHDCIQHGGYKPMALLECKGHF